MWLFHYNCLLHSMLDKNIKISSFKSSEKIKEKRMAQTDLSRIIIILNELKMRVKSMQRPGTETIKTQIQPSKPKREITKITNSQNTKRT